MAIRDKVIKEMELRLGGQMVDVELDPEHYDLAIDKALDKYRQRSENAVEESFLMLNLVPGTSEYILPREVIEVKDIYRRGSGVSQSGGTAIEPFQTQYLNTYLSNVSSGGLATYDALAQNLELMGRMFGAEYTFTYNHPSRKLTLHRNIKAKDTVYVHTYNFRPEEELFDDTYAKPWLKDYAFAHARLMLAEARGKFNQIAGPQGGTSLNADALRADAQQDLEKLEADLVLYAEGSTGLSFVIG